MSNLNSNTSQLKSTTNKLKSTTNKLKSKTNQLNSNTNQLKSNTNKLNSNISNLNTLANQLNYEKLDVKTFYIKTELNIYEKLMQFSLIYRAVEFIIDNIQIDNVNNNNKEIIFQNIENNKGSSLSEIYKEDFDNLTHYYNFILNYFNKRGLSPNGFIRERWTPVAPLPGQSLQESDRVRSLRMSFMYTNLHIIIFNLFLAESWVTFPKFDKYINNIIADFIELHIIRDKNKKKESGFLRKPWSIITTPVDPFIKIITDMRKDSSNICIGSRNNLKKICNIDLRNISDKLRYNLLINLLNTGYLWTYFLKMKMHQTM
jgi:X-X-X-Leu-X-X-Gly heptad repeat protein